MFCDHRPGRVAEECNITWRRREKEAALLSLWPCCVQKSSCVCLPTCMFVYKCRCAHARVYACRGHRTTSGITLYLLPCLRQGLFVVCQAGFWGFVCLCFSSVAGVLGLQTRICTLVSSISRSPSVTWVLTFASSTVFREARPAQPSEFLIQSPGLCWMPQPDTSEQAV